MGLELAWCVLRPTARHACNSLFFFWTFFFLALCIYVLPSIGGNGKSFTPKIPIFVLFALLFSLRQPFSTMHTDSHLSNGECKKLYGINFKNGNGDLLARFTIIPCCFPYEMGEKMLLTSSACFYCCCVITRGGLDRAHERLRFRKVGG